MTPEDRAIADAQRVVAGRRRSLREDQGPFALAPNCSRTPTNVGADNQVAST
jgi:hypothetical protein